MKDLITKADHMENGECYHNVMKTIYVNSEDWVPVHGVCIGRGEIEGVKHGHAWMESESTGMVYDPSADMMLPKFLYYDLGKIEFVVRYDRETYNQNMLDSGHSGPWCDEIYKAEEELYKCTV